MSVSASYLAQKALFCLLPAAVNSASNQTRYCNEKALLPLTKHNKALFLAP